MTEAVISRSSLVQLFGTIYIHLYCANCQDMKLVATATLYLDRSVGLYVISKSVFAKQARFLVDRIIA